MVQYEPAESNLDFSPMKEESKNTLFAQLDGMEGTKVLVWDPALRLRLALVTGGSEILERNVTKMFDLAKGACTSQSADHVVFVVQPDLRLMDAVASNLRSIKANDPRQFHLMFIPNVCILCQKKLSDAGVLSRLESVVGVPIDSYYLAKDVLSMEYHDSFKDIYLYNDRSGLWHIMACIQQIEALYGTIPNIYYKGDAAQTVVNMLLKGREQNNTVNSSPPLPQTLIESVILFDRSVDLLSPLITQLTYEGLIDEIFGIKHSGVKLPAEKFSSTSDAQASVSSESSPDGDSTTTKLIRLSSREDLYTELRDLNFQGVGPALRKTVKSVTEQLEERHKATSVRDYKEFVKRLPKLQALRESAGTHTNIAELIKQSTTTGSFLDVIQSEQELLNSVDSDRVIPFIEDSIIKGEPIEMVLRLICIQSLSTEGLKAKIFDAYKTLIVQSYGIETLPLLHNLETSGLLRVQSSKNPAYAALKAAEGSYGALRKALRLIVDDVNELEPHDVSYVWSGYAGIIARLIQYWNKPGWRGITDIVKRLPGAFAMLDHDKQQKVIRSASAKQNSPSSESKLSDTEPKYCVLLVFIGGITSAEISAVRFLGNKDAKRPRLEPPAGPSVTNFEDPSTDVHKGLQDLQKLVNENRTLIEENRDQIIKNTAEINAMKEYYKEMEKTMRAGIDQTKKEEVMMYGMRIQDTTTVKEEVLKFLNDTIRDPAQRKLTPDDLSECKQMRLNKTERERASKSHRPLPNRVLMKFASFDTKMEIMKNMYKLRDYNISMGDQNLPKISLNHNHEPLKQQIVDYMKKINREHNREYKVLEHGDEPMLNKGNKFYTLSEIPPNLITKDIGVFTTRIKTMVKMPPILVDLEAGGSGSAPLNVSAEVVSSANDSTNTIIHRSPATNASGDNNATLTQ